jgi:hypothetical protein
MRPSDSEIKVLQATAARVGLAVKYRPSKTVPCFPWLMTRTHTGFSWRVKDAVRVMFHIGNEDRRAKLLKRIAAANLRGK